MSALEKIIWKEEKDVFRGGNVDYLEPLYKMFPGCPKIFKDNKKKTRATFLFKNPTNGKIATVVCSEAVTELYRLGKLKESNLMTLTVGYAVHEASGEPGLWLCLPPNGWTEQEAQEEFDPESLA